ncbi:VgrG protein [hydrothermal vent metagenome]|uniref:VgrG protein n=1 Tax=hydrothermal vent metagenome TaxID=652676 RepID=A0A3B0XG02_9ZZZZ
MSNLTQDQRLISIATPLDKDELLLTSFEGTDYVSDLFEFQIEVLSSNHSIKPEQLIGKTVTVTIQNDQKRTFNGYISNFTYGEIKADNLRVYRMTMVPWLWFLSKNNHHRIFQEMNTKDIVSSVFKDLGFNDFDYKATGNPTVREYCVQHNESDLNFISRLLEEDGIAYYFEQKDDKHKMHIVDAANAYQECAETNLTYSKGNQPNTQLTRWEHVYEFRKGKWSLDDYDFNKPKADQFQTTASTSKFANAKNYEHYEYAPYHDFSGIKDLSKKRIEAEEVSMNTIEASSDCSSFYAGGKFKLSKHAVKEEKGNYVIIAIRHRAIDSSYLSSNESHSEYSNDLVCIPDNVHYRPALTHPKPVMSGPQSAVVVGASGEEIYVDKEGRIKVQFHWDRVGKKDEKSTCYIRVMQPWAGSGWGTSFIPRIGMEVVVNFFDGDPDRPIITGSVYNGDNKPPFSSKTQSGIKTRSSKGGSPANFNELRFDDLKGSEQIFIHAEKNMDTEVENDETLTIDNDRTKLVKHDENSTIENDRNKTVNNNQTETIAKNKTIDVGANHTESIDKNMTINIVGDLKESVKGLYSENVTKAYDMQAKTITMQAEDKIILKTGAASIVMKSNGDITISGKTINVKGSGNVIIKGSKVTTN